MTYLLAIGWEWFAGALVIGLLVGLFTATRAPGAVFSGGWVIIIGALALGGLAAASFMEVLPGRDGLTLDIALLAALAYFFGLPVGGGVRSLFPAPKAAAPTPHPKPKPIVRAPAQAKAVSPAPVMAEHVGAGAPAPEATSVILPDAPQSTAKRQPGAPPPFLAAPVDGKGDNLSKIKGLGPKSVKKLNALGVYHYEQIAAWNLDNARWIGAQLGTPGRVERGKWIQQARELAAHPKTKDKG